MTDYEAYGYSGLFKKLKAMLFLPKPPSRAMLVAEVVADIHNQVGRPSDSLQERLKVASGVNLGVWKRWQGYETALKQAIVDGWVTELNGKYYFAIGGVNNSAATKS